MGAGGGGSLGGPARVQTIQLLHTFIYCNKQTVIVLRISLSFLFFLFKVIGFNSVTPSHEIVIL